MPRLLDLADGPLMALTRAIERTTMPALPVLLTGTPKVILIGWFGDLSDLNSFDPDQGDGLFQVLEEGDPRYQPLPPALLHTRSPEPNVRMGVPFWLLAAPSPAALERDPRSSTTLATGCIHPLYNSATADVYCPESGMFQCRRYVLDYRTDPSDVADLQYSLDQQKAVTQMGGTPATAPLKAPRYCPACLTR